MTVSIMSTIESKLEGQIIPQWRESKNLNKSLLSFRSCNALAISRLTWKLLSGYCKDEFQEIFVPHSSQTNLSSKQAPLKPTEWILSNPFPVQYLHPFLTRTTNSNNKDMLTRVYLKFSAVWECDASLKVPVHLISAAMCHCKCRFTWKLQISLMSLISNFGDSTMASLTNSSSLFLFEGL